MHKRVEQRVEKLCRIFQSNEKLLLVSLRLRLRLRLRLYLGTLHLEELVKGKIDIVQTPHFRSESH